MENMQDKVTKELETITPLTDEELKEVTGGYPDYFDIPKEDDHSLRM